MIPQSLDYDQTSVTQTGTEQEIPSCWSRGICKTNTINALALQKHPERHAKHPKKLLSAYLRYSKT
jgi:hypothetical protein